MMTMIIVYYCDSCDCPRKRRQALHTRGQYWALSKTC